MSKPTYVLGTGLSHNGSACLLKDGKIVVAIEKERITRRKHDGFNDTDAINYCLEAEGIGWDDIDLVVQNAVFSNFEEGNDWYFGPRVIPDHVRVVTIPHHVAHAYCAFGMSPFDECAVLVIDGEGSRREHCFDGSKFFCDDNRAREIVSFYKIENYKVSLEHKQFSSLLGYATEDSIVKRSPEDSVGALYSGVSRYVFDDVSDVGQLMGISAFGKNTLNARHFEFDGLNIRTNYDWARSLKRRTADPDRLTKDFKYYAGVAKFTQDEIDRVVTTLLNKLYKLAPLPNLCFAGGVALNVVTNTKIVQDTPYKNLFVPPPAADNGVAIGCAYYGWLEVLHKPRVEHSGSPFLGRTYDTESNEVVGAVLKALPNIKVSTPSDLSNQVAKLIATGKIVGWYKGGAEIGPRALGHRSILGNPCDPGMKDRINNAIKNRPDFRPFAPAVLAEDAGIYFDIDRPSPYMLMVFDVREDWQGRIPAVTHVDNTARVQTVSETDDKDFYELLKEVKRETGIGMVLNTSFNRRHEPIVERPQEAVQMFLDTPMDALVLGPYLLTK